MLAALLAACPLPMGPDWQKVVFVPRVDIPFGADATVGNYNLQAYVPVPTAGTVPVKTNTGRGDVDIAVVWKDAAGQALGESFDQFVLGVVYQADITLTAKNGYGFDPGMRFRYQPEDTVAVQPADNSSANIRSLSAVRYFPTGEGMTIPSPIDLTALVPAPVMSATPVTSFFAGTYGGTVAWKSGGSGSDGLFKAITAYGAEVTLYPAVGYMFPANIEVIHSGATIATLSFTRTAGTVSGAVAFPATGTVPALAVTDADLTYKVPSPVRGGTPVEYFSAPQYTGRVDWFVGGTTVPHSVFQANMTYTAKVTLTPTSGYTFGRLAVNFTHADAVAATVDNGNGTITVTTTFPATTAAAAVPVNDWDLTYRIPAPVRGGTPVTYFAAPQYTGNVTWTSGGQNLGGLFEANTAYTAAITLTAASGYTFTGVNASFTHGGAEIITHLNGNTVRVRFHATTSATAAQVSDLNLTGKVPAPVRGGTPVSYFSAPEYTGTVNWSVTSGGQALGGLFEAGTAYTATVTLTAVSGFTFAGVGANAFTHSGGTAANAAGSSVVTLAFPATSGVAAIMISDRDLTYKIPAPVRGGTPVTYFSTPQYTGTVDWFVGGSSAPHSVFQANMTYTARVTLSAAAGYTFGSPAAAFSHTGASSITTAAGTGVTVTIIFPATTSAAAVTVSDVDLTARVPKPVRDGTAAVYFAAPQYTGSVAWKQTGSNTPLEGLFGANTAYTATVTLTAASGYTFTGVGANAFTCGGAASVSNSADSGTVVIAFPATNTTPATVVNDLNLTGKVAAPVRGGTPAGYFSTSQYTGTVAWTVTSGGQALGGLFEAGTAYTATVTLTAVSGFTFAGVGANAFTHSGGTAANAANTGLVTISFPATTSVAAIPVSDLDLTYKVPAPVKDGTPAVYISDPQYTGTVTWAVYPGGQALSGVFGAGTAYTATVTLAAASGYTFTGVGANAFTHAHRSSITNAANTGVITIVFPATTSVAATVVGDLDLTGKVPAPVSGGTPVSYFSAPEYMGTVAWAVTSGSSLYGLFAASTYYTATVTLTAASGFTLTGIDGHFTHARAAGITAAADNTGTVTVTIAFPTTDGTPAAAVNDLNLTAKVHAPVWGGTPVSYFSAPQYAGTVTWKETVTGTALSGLFGANTAYTATVTLTAASGYTFTGVAANSFTHSGKSTIGNAGNSGVVTITFPATTGAAAAIVGDLNLTAKVHAPVSGGTPVSYFSAPQYTGNVAWKRTDNNAALSGLFGAGTYYTATVTLTAASGYTFTGVTANSFTHSDNSTISNTMNSGVVTITFPATGGTAVTVTEVDLTARIAVPVSAGIPTTYFSASQYTGTVAWKRTDNGTALSGLFGANTAYTATVTLTAASGYTFTGVTANSFTHSGRSTIGNAENSGVVTITFPATSPASATAINSVNLTTSVPAPVTSSNPVTSFNAGTYSGNIAWTTVGGVPVTQFEADTVYRATVSLYPAAGYSFPSTLPVTLGSINANFTGEPRQGTITFPETGGLLFYSGPFSGSAADNNDSVIDVIRAAKAAGQNSLYLILSPRVDTVVLDAGTDLSATGLALNSTNCPANLVIDGGRRTVQLAVLSRGASLITVGTGVTLTLRNITIKDSEYNSGFPVVTTTGTGQLITETGAVIGEDRPISWVVTTLAGTGVAGVAEGTGAAAQFNTPRGVALDASGNVYVADTLNHRIRKITPGGVVSTLAGSSQGYGDGTGTGAQFTSPRGVAVDGSGNVYVADTLNNRIRRITPGGVVSTFAGSGAAGSANGTGTVAQFNLPEGLAIDAQGSLYVADTNNHLIRKITSGGVVSTLAGSGAAGSANGTGAMAQFRYPEGLTVDGAGNVYVADLGNFRIRKITPGGEVSTFAGSGTAGFNDGTGTVAQFNNPMDAAFDVLGNLYVADEFNCRIRRITPGGVVTTIAGSATSGSVDGTGAAARFQSPLGIAADAQGNLYVADAAGHRIRKITPVIP